MSTEFYHCHSKRAVIADSRVAAMSAARLDRTCSRKADIHVGDAATIVCDGCGAGVGGPVRRPATSTNDPPGQPDAGRRSLLSMLRQPDRRSRGCGGRFRRRQAVGTRSRRPAWRSGAVFPAAQPYALPRYVPGYSPAFRRSASAGGHDPRRVRLHPQGRRTRPQPVDQTAACDAPPGTFASPGYLERFGTPRTPDELDGHEMVGFLAPDMTEIIPLAFRAGGDIRRFTLPTMMTVTSPRDECGRRLSKDRADPGSSLSRRVGIGG